MAGRLQMCPPALHYLLAALRPASSYLLRMMSNQMTGLIHIPGLKIGRLEPLVKTHRRGKSLWLAQDPCEASVHCHPIWHILDI
jgi:hypothetical protein